MKFFIQINLIDKTIPSHANVFSNQDIIYLLNDFQIYNPNNSNIQIIHHIQFHVSKPY